MKKLAMIAALLLSGGVLFAEPIANGPRSQSNMQIWKSSNVAANSSAAKVSNSAFLHQVLVSSPAAVDYSTAAVLTIYGTQDGSGEILARVQTSTTEYTSEDATRWIFDVYAATGMSVTLTTGNASGDQAGSVQIIYQNGPIENFRVWSSSFIPSDTSTRTLVVGPGILHKVSVLKAATGTSALRIYNASSTAPTEYLSQIDLTAGDREYDFNVSAASGITVNIDQNGTVSAEVMFFFKRHPMRDWEYWTPFFASGTVTNAAIFAGRGVFGGVLNGDNVATSQLTVYDSNGTANNKIADIDGATVFDFDDSNYEVHVTSGLTVTSVGAGQYTIRYRRLR